MAGTTPVPNEVFDAYLRELKPGELKVLLLVVRQTYGYQDPKSPTKRKQRDWISGTRMTQLTGLSRKSISTAIKTLQLRGFISITDHQGRLLFSRKRQRLYFSLGPRLGKSCGYTGEIDGLMRKKFPFNGKKVRNTK